MLTRYYATMKLILRFIDICLFKSGPADIPASHWLFKLSLIIYFIIGVIVSRVDSNWEISLFTSLIDLVVMIAFTAILLKSRGMLNRYQQTVTAMAGAGSCLGIVAIPVLVLFNSVSEQVQTSSLVMLLVIALMLWSLMITAHIFRQALEIKAGTAVMITIIYTILSLIAVGLTLSGLA